MSPAEICALSQASLDEVLALKKGFDVTLEVLAVSGAKQDLHKVETLKEQIDYNLHNLPVAYNIEHIGNQARVYIGKLEIGMFKNFPKSIEHVYTRFPERELQLERLGIGGKTSEELQELTEKNQIIMYGHSQRMLDRPNFVTSKEPEQMDLIKLTVEDLGLGNSPTTDEIYARIAELGLELCPPEVGPHYRLAHLDQTTNDWVNIGMKPIPGGFGGPCVFRVGRLSARLGLDGQRTEPGDQWSPDDQFLFRLRRDT